jgi:hypothetical protein
MFLFFSNHIGLAGSILVSVLFSLLLLLYNLYRPVAFTVDRQSLRHFGA